MKQASSLCKCVAMKRHLAIAIICLAQADLALAQEPGHAPEHDRGFHHRHHLGAFLGGTSSTHGSGFTVAADYEFRLQRYVGLGVTAETVAGALNENVVVGLVYFHPTERLAVFGGGGWDRRLGLSRKPEPSTKSSDSSAEDAGARKPLGRLGILYEIPIGKAVALSPNLSLDFVTGTTVAVYGVTIGFKF